MKYNVEFELDHLPCLSSYRLELTSEGDTFTYGSLRFNNDGVVVRGGKLTMIVREDILASVLDMLGYDEVVYEVTPLS